MFKHTSFKHAVQGMRAVHGMVALKQGKKKAWFKGKPCLDMAQFASASECTRSQASQPANNIQAMKKKKRKMKQFGSTWFIAWNTESDLKPNKYKLQVTQQKPIN